MAEPVTPDLVARLRHDAALDPEVRIAVHDLTYLADAAAEIERLQARACPHAVEGKEGTGHCAVAEDVARGWAAARDEKTRLVRAIAVRNTRIADLEQACDEARNDSLYWVEHAGRLDRERADWKRWCEEREAEIEGLRARVAQLEAEAAAQTRQTCAVINRGQSAGREAPR